MRRIYYKFESTRINKLGWFDLNVAFLRPIKLLSVSDVFIPRLRFKFFTNAPDNNKEHIMRLDRFRLSGRDDL